jgi:hypothetical protein
MSRRAGRAGHRAAPDLIAKRAGLARGLNGAWGDKKVA